MTKLVWALALALVLTGACRRAEHSPADPRSSAPQARLRIGYQKGAVLNVLRIRGALERRLGPQGVTIQWIDFPAGPQLLEAIAVGTIDIGSAGDAPAIFAQAAGANLVYVANIPVGDRRLSSGIMVGKDSPIRQVGDLRGRKIALQKASASHTLLVQVLERAGLSLADVRPVYLAPPDARPAFDAGRVDAWAIWDPFLSIAQRATGARLLVSGEGLASGGGFYMAAPEFARKRPDWIRALLEELAHAGQWAAAEPRAAAELLAPQMGIDVDIAELIQIRLARSQYRGARPLDDEIMKTQQSVADLFLRLGLLPKPLDVRALLLAPEHYAALAPPSWTQPARVAP